MRLSKLTATRQGTACLLLSLLCNNHNSALGGIDSNDSRPDQSTTCNPYPPPCPAELKSRSIQVQDVYTFGCNLVACVKHKLPSTLLAY